MGRIVAIAVLGTICAACSSAPVLPPAAERPAPTIAAPSPTPAPATHSGPLSIGSFPSPDQLGPGWRYRVDPGDPEAGYVGNGTPGLERDPDEVGALAVPLGCRREAKLPRADHAFEVDYEFRGSPVVTVRLVFDSRRRAGSFVSARQRDLRACVGISGGPAVGPYVGRVRGPLNDRTPESEPWTELLLHRGRGVLLMAAPVALGDPPFTADGVRRVQGAVG